MVSLQIAIYLQQFPLDIRTFYFGKIRNMRGQHRTMRPTEPKCNAQFAQSKLRSAISADSIFNFLIFLSKHFNSLQRYHTARTENETGVPGCLTFTPDDSMPYASFFLPNVSECLISSHGWAADRRFFAKNAGGLQAMVARIQGCLIFPEEVTAPKP